VFQYLAILAAITAYATIVLVGRSAGWGRTRVPDWPLCHGSVVPDFGRDGVAIEYAHRLVAALTSLFILLTFVLAFLWFDPDRIVLLSFVTLALLVTRC